MTETIRIAVVGAGERGIASLGAIDTRGIEQIRFVRAPRQAYSRCAQRMRDELAGCDLVIVVAGLGSTAALDDVLPVGGAARDVGALTVGIVGTAPRLSRFDRVHAAAEVRRLAAAVDSLFVLSGDVIGHGPFSGAAGVPDGETCVSEIVRGLVCPLILHGFICYDFGDLIEVTLERGAGLFGTARARGPGACLGATRGAVQSPLLGEQSLAAATGVLAVYTGGAEMTLMAINTGATWLNDAADPAATVMFCALVDESLEGAGVTVYATGLKRLPFLDEESHLAR